MLEAQNPQQTLVSREQVQKARPSSQGFQKAADDRSMMITVTDRGRCRE